MLSKRFENIVCTIEHTLEFGLHIFMIFDLGNFFSKKLLNNVNNKI